MTSRRDIQHEKTDDKHTNIEIFSEFRDKTPEASLGAQQWPDPRQPRADKMRSTQ